MKTSIPPDVSTNPSAGGNKLCNCNVCGRYKEIAEIGTSDHLQRQYTGVSSKGGMCDNTRIYLILSTF